MPLKKRLDPANVMAPKSSDAQQIDVGQARQFLHRADSGEIKRMARAAEFQEGMGGVIHWCGLGAAHCRWVKIAVEHIHCG
ncbi:MAG: hypothetical protein JWM38_1098 [Sphingomonas bacterium]|nr:hypothetical protein [Sphingomonas bacterium]MDB5717671.1 hypothetical protein [Sphingomonas bacterium]